MAEAKAPRAPFAPWDRRELPGSFSVEETAARVGHYKWIEMRLFEALGGWVATVPELDVKMRLGTHTYHHAWHAELWHKRLPELREMNPERLTAPPNDEMVAFVEAMTEPEAPELTIEKLVGVYRVLIPHKIAAYTYHLNNTSTITDAPTTLPGASSRNTLASGSTPPSSSSAWRKIAGFGLRIPTADESTITSNSSSTGTRAGHVPAASFTLLVTSPVR